MWVVNHVWTTNSHSLSVSVDQWEGRWMNESLMWFDINLPFSPVLHSNMATQRSTRLILSGNLWQYRAQFSVKCTTWVVSKLQSSKSRALSSVGSYKQNCCCTLKVLPLFYILHESAYRDNFYCSHFRKNPQSNFLSRQTPPTVSARRHSLYHKQWLLFLVVKIRLHGEVQLF